MKATSTTNTGMLSSAYHLCNFILLFLVNYRDALKQQYNLGQYFLEVSIEDISSFDEMLAHKLQKQPAEYLPLVSAWYELCYFVLKYVNT